MYQLNFYDKRTGCEDLKDEPENTFFKYDLWTVKSNSSRINVDVFGLITSPLLVAY